MIIYFILKLAKTKIRQAHVEWMYVSLSLLQVYRDKPGRESSVTTSPSASPRKVTSPSSSPRLSLKTQQSPYGKSPRSPRDVHYDRWGLLSYTVFSLSFWTLSI